MRKVSMPVSCCKSGDVLAEDVYNDNGIILIAKRTVINEYLKKKLIEMRISDIWLYQPAEHLCTEVKKGKNKGVSKTYKDTVIKVKQFLQELSSGNPLDIKVVKELSRDIIKEKNESRSIIQCLKEIRNTDEYTYTHCVNVAFYAMLLAKWLGLSENEIEEVIQAGILHDIGKIKIPNKILNKNGKLTAQEFEVMKKHSEYGYEILLNTPGVKENVSKAVLQHHERLDGSGYPDMCKGEAITIQAKIIAIADVYDAMTQNRIYKPKMSPFESFEIFLTTGICCFDPKILNVFLKNISLCLIGTKVLLNNGQKGEIVYVPPQDIVCPIVYIGDDYIDLSREKELKVVTIV